MAADLKGVTQRTPRQRSEKDKHGNSPIAASAKKPPSISMPEGVILYYLNVTCSELQKPESETTIIDTFIPNAEGKEQPGNHMTGEYVTTPGTAQIGKVVKPTSMIAPIVLF